MRHTYNINGATCQTCNQKVAKVLKNLPGITNIDQSQKGQVTIEMSKHIDTKV
jgi:copper chaperone CopZ